MRPRQRCCSAKRRSWAYTRHSQLRGETVRRGRGAALRRPGPAAVRRRAPRTGSASRRWPYAPCRRACARRRGRGAGAARRLLPGLRAHRPSRGSLTARRWRGAGRTRCSPAHARRLVVGRRGRHAVDLSWAFGLPIVLKACDKQHAEDERHNEAPARAWREECTTDGLRVVALETVRKRPQTRSPLGSGTTEFYHSGEQLPRSTSLLRAALRA